MTPDPAFPIVEGTTGAPSLLRRHTCVLLRQVIPQAEIATAQAKLEETYAHLSSMDLTDRPLFFESHAMVAPPIIGAMGEALMDWIEAMVRRTPAIRVMEKVLDGPVVAHRDTIRLRRHAPQQSVSFVPWHQDLFFMGADSRYVNCWIPLTDCGEDAPALDLYPHKAPISLPIEGAADNSYGMRAIELAELERQFGTDAYWTPSMKVGDCLLFDSSCVHRTSQGPLYTQLRESIEIRFGI